MNATAPRASIITVVYNGAAAIRHTIDSVLAQRGAAPELVVVDGGSTDGTQTIVADYGPAVSCFVSEPDRGIYDAMNKGIALASGEFVLMMNSSDVFADEYALAAALDATHAGVPQVLFGGWDRRVSGARRTSCRPDPARAFFNHQAVLYSRSLHERFGPYVSVPGFSTADYLFFCTVLASPDVLCHTLDRTLAQIDVTGVSAGLHTISQKFAIDHLFGRADRMRLLAVLALHPAYHRVKRWLRGAT